MGQKRLVFGLLAAFGLALSSNATAADGYSHLTCKSVAKHSGFSLESSLQVKLNLKSRKVCLGDDCDQEIPVTRTGKFITWTSDNCVYRLNSGMTSLVSKCSDQDSAASSGGLPEDDKLALSTFTCRASRP
jgi:hypothetical protein